MGLRLLNVLPLLALGQQKNAPDALAILLGSRQLLASRQLHTNDHNFQDSMEVQGTSRMCSLGEVDDTDYFADVDSISDATDVESTSGSTDQESVLDVESVPHLPWVRVLWQLPPEDSSWTLGPEQAGSADSSFSSGHIHVSRPRSQQSEEQAAEALEADNSSSPWDTPEDGEDTLDGLSSLEEEA